MRFLLLMGIVTLHVASFKAENSIGSIKFLGNDESFIPAAKSRYYATPQFRAQALNAVTDSASAFAAEFFKNVGRNVEGNLVCSPISASMILSMAAYGARGSTELKMHDVLHLPQKISTALIGFQTLIDSLATYKKVDLNLANKMYFPFGIRPQQQFTKIVTEAFRSEVESLDFHNSEGARRIINDWCAEQTNDRIKEIIGSGDIDRTTALVLVNAVYFKGVWLNKFKPELTIERSFHVDRTTKKNVPTMHAIGTYGYGELHEAKATFVELPYTSDDPNHNISMFIILPNERDGLAHLEKNMVNINVKQLLRAKSDVLVDLALPKFNIESDISLEEPLQRMGLAELFESPDFSGIVRFPRLRITKFVQKAVITVDEEGSEASAATAVLFGFRSGGDDVPQIVDFIADHPFIAIIATTSNNPVHLFTARYTGN